MKILIDVPIEDERFSEKGQFFFSVELSETESIAFDYTFAGHRVMKQILIGTTQSKKESAETWGTIRIVDGKFIDKHRVEWIDRREKGEAIVNGNIWRTVWEKPLPEGIKEKLLDFSSQIYKHKSNLLDLEELFEDLDKYIRQIIGSYML